MYTLWQVHSQHNERNTGLMTSIILFACCQGLLLYCAGWTVYQTVPHTTEGWQDYQVLFANRTFVQLALSLAVRPFPSFQLALPFLPSKPRTTILSDLADI